MKPKGKLKAFSDNMSNNYGMAWDVVLGACGALLAALVYVAVFAGCIKLFKIGENTVPVVNQVSKALCMLLSSWICVLRHPAKGWLRGGLAGMLYVVLSFLLFSCIDGNWSIGWFVLADLLMGAAVGAIGGILFVNFRKKEVMLRTPGR